MKLIVAEKPSAAERIARSISPRDVNQKRSGKVRYYEFEEDGNRIVVAPCAGHLFGLTTKKDGYPVLFAEYKPMNEIEDDAKYLEEYIDLIKEVGKKADEFISAADYDTEGSVIAYNAFRFCLSPDVPKSAKRMKFSSLTSSELRRAYRNMSEELDWGMVHAGLARAYMDFIWGLTTSRALMKCLENSGEKGTLSAGRVQTPTLKMLAEREREIDNFEPEPYWLVELHLAVNGEKIKVKTKKIWEKERAEKLRDKYSGESAFVSFVGEEIRSRYPPSPFNLSDLQSEGSSKLNYAPAKVQSIAQDLYDRALISYPRTSSQKLPQDLNYRKVIQKLSSVSSLEASVRSILSKKKLSPNEGDKDDPAHPAIYPTRAPKKKLNSERWDIYELVSRRFLATFSDPAKIVSQKIVLSVEGDEFEASGKYYTDDGWLKIYGRFARKNEDPLPEVSEGDELEVEEAKLLERKTNPPRRYTKSSIIKEMERKNIGTKATRAPILEKLRERSYIEEGRKIKVTRLGLSVIDSVETHVPEITKIDLTRDFENKMEMIRDGKTSHYRVVNEARNRLKEISEEFRKNEKDIGDTLAEAKRRIRKRKKEQKSLGECPECGEGSIIVKRSKKDKKFAGCECYPECENSYSTPQKHFRILKSSCEECGLRLLSLEGKHGRFHLCVNCGPVN
ncbi:MAG: DNA topoisomerase I [Candidatus Hadarchaeota archaeon]